MTSFSSSSRRALVIGAVIGFVAAFGPGCDGGKGISRCTVSNCEGCCDDSGQCQKGTSEANCGAGAATCVGCAVGRSCLKLSSTSDFGGKCSGTGGGDGGTGGGSGGSGDTGICNASTCSNGCCNGTSCVVVTNTAKCGQGGAACAPCGAGNTCVSGVCSPCNGCVDISTGQCKSGTEMTACGRTGGFCQSCDSLQGQACNGGVCSGGSSCNATTCPDGCCDGATCTAKSTYTQFQCGSGMPGTACVSCQTACDTDAGTCSTGSLPGGFGLDGGFGFPIGCVVSPDCAVANECCDRLGIFSACRAPGEKCRWSSPLGGKTCDGTTRACQ